MSQTILEEQCDLLRRENDRLRKLVKKENKSTLQKIIELREQLKELEIQWMQEMARKS